MGSSKIENEKNLAVVHIAIVGLWWGEDHPNKAAKRSMSTVAQATHSTLEIKETVAYTIILIQPQVNYFGHSQFEPKNLTEF